MENFKNLNDFRIDLHEVININKLQTPVHD